MSTDKLIKESWSIAVPDNRDPARVRLWKAIAAVRDASPRVGDDAETEDIIDAILAVGFGDLAKMRAERDAALARAWEEGREAGADDENFWQRGSSGDSDAAEHPHKNPYSTEAAE